MKSKPRKHIALLTSLFITAVLTTMGARAEVQMIDRVVAIVDSAVITQNDLDDRLRGIIKSSKARNLKLPPLSLLRKQVLDQLIYETLQFNLAKRFDGVASDTEVNQAIERIKARNQISVEQLEQQLASDGQTMNEFRETLRRQITLDSVSNALVTRKIKISEADIDNFLNSADAKFWISPEYHLQHILIPVDGRGTEANDRARAKAEEVYAKLQQGANFAELAIAESKGPAALNGGDLGFRKATELPSLFAELAPDLDINEVSKPTRSQAGFHILKLLNKKGQNKRVVTQNKVRHILVKTSEILTKEAAYQKINDVREQILDGADFADMAKDHSEDIGSRLSGGEMGWTNPGTFVPAFEKAVQTIEVGTLSEPIFTQFGWHILEVMERRDEDLSENVRRNKAKNLLVSRRFEDEKQVWLQELKDNAFIDIKI